MSLEERLAAAMEAANEETILVDFDVMAGEMVVDWSALARVVLEELAPAQTVTSERQLYELPHGAVVLGAKGSAWEKEIHNGFHYWWQTGDGNAEAGRPNIPLPARLLWHPSWVGVTDQ